MIALAVVVLLVLLVSAACSLFEAVLYSVRGTRIEALERAGRRPGRWLRALRERVDRPIAAILSLNTFANTGGGALAGALAAATLGEHVVGWFAVAFTLAVLMLAEIVPKTLGVVYADRVAPWIAGPLTALVILMKPMIWLTRLGTASIGKGRTEGVSDEDLLSLVGLGVRAGSFKAHEASVIRNVLALETRRVREILTPRPVVFALSSAATVREATARPELRRFSRVPVHDAGPEDQIGFVHKIDILAAAAEGRSDVRLETLMRPIEFVVDSAPLDELFRLFIERRAHIAAVIDEFGGLAGIVTLEDVLEEIIGREIVDEYDYASDLREVAHRRRDEILGRRPAPPRPGE
jgi:CBS domain containing-hemolysin-like protein